MVDLSQVLCFDVAWWDDTLPAGAGVGTLLPDDVHPAERVVGWTPQGYRIAKVVEVADAEATPVDAHPPPWLFVAGLRVKHADRVWDVVRADPGRLLLADEATSVVDMRLPNPDDVRIPVAVPLAWLLGIAWARRVRAE